MNKCKVYFSLLAFALLMGIKCFQPGLAQSICTRFIAAIDSEGSFAGFVETLGREYAKNGLREELAEALGMADWLENVFEGGHDEQSAAASQTPLPAESAEG